MNRSTATLMDTSWREWTALNILVVTKDCKVDVEITARIQTASCAIGRLRERVFDCRNLIVEIKLIVYIHCVIHLMIDDSETWTLYRYHISSSEPSTDHLRYFFNIRWDHLITNDEVLDLTHTTDVEITLITNRLPWLGHVALMPDERSIKALLYGEESSRRVGRPFLRFKGILNDIWWAEQYSRRGETL